MSLQRTAPQTAPGTAPPATRRERLNSLSTRIILFVFLSTLLTASVVSWLSVAALFRDNRSQIQQQNDALLAERGSQLEAWRAKTETDLLAAIQPGTSWHNEILKALPKSGNGHTVLLPVPEPLTGHLGRVEVGALPRASGATQPEDEENCLAIEARLPREPISDEVALFVEGCLAQERLLEILKPPVGDDHNSRLLVVDDSGQVLAAAGVRASTRIGSLLKIPAPLRSLHRDDDATSSEQPPSENLLSYADGADGGGTFMVASVRPLSESSWILVAERPRNRAYATAMNIVKVLVVVDICIVLFFTFLAYKITLAIMKPIEALSKGAQRIGSGQVDYQIPLPPNSSDELGLLTRTFNDMMGRLRRNQLEIEQDRVRLGEKNEELQRANEILSQLSITDGLTKLHNHRYFQDHLTREIKRSSRTKAPLTLILIDIDDFKLLNDTHGHAAGDEVLISLASIMNDSARESDLIARYGGEEFVVLMPNTDLPGATHLAEKIRMTTESTRLIIGDTFRPVDVTISVGVARYEGDRRDFFAAADRALYQAKAAGKNCVVLGKSDDEDTPCHKNASATGKLDESGPESSDA